MRLQQAIEDYKYADWLVVYEGKVRRFNDYAVLLEEIRYMVSKVINSTTDDTFEDGISRLRGARVYIVTGEHDCGKTLTFEPVTVREGGVDSVVDVYTLWCTVGFDVYGR